MKKIVYALNIEQVDEGGYVVNVPMLPGCYSQGETLDEAVGHAREAIEVYLESLGKHGEAIPAGDIDRG
jgi:antitoxin HicB